MKNFLPLLFTLLVSISALAQSQNVPVTIYGNADGSRVLQAAPLNEAPQTLLWKTIRLFHFRLYTMTEAFAGPARFVIDFPTSQWFSPPIVTNGMIVFIFRDDNGYLYALDAATGKEIIILKFSGNRISAPAVRGSQIFFGDSKGVVRAFDVATRSERWSFEQKNHSAVKTPPVLDDDFLFIHFERLGLHAIELATGKAQWMQKLSDTPFRLSVSGDKVVLITGPGAMICFDRKLGTKQWEVKVTSEARSLALMGDQAFVAFDDGAIHAYSLADGSIRWKAKPSGGAGTAMATARQLVFFSGREYNIIAVDAMSGAEKWKFRTNHRCGAPLLAGDVLYASCADKKIYAIDALTGKAKWLLENKGSIPPTPTFADGVMYLLGGDGYLHAFK